MRFLRWILIVACTGLTVGSGARAESLQDTLYAACVASGSYRELPISESETCHCWAGIVAQHLTPGTAKQIAEATDEGVVLNEASYIGGSGPVSIALLENCPGVQAQWDRLNRPTVVASCKEAFKTRLSNVEIEWACKRDAEMGDAEAQYYMGVIVPCWMATPVMTESGHRAHASTDWNGFADPPSKVTIEDSSRSAKGMLTVMA